MNDTDFGFEGDFKEFVNDLDAQEQPTCNIDDPENCESCSG